MSLCRWAEKKGLWWMEAGLDVHGLLGVWDSEHCLPWRRDLDCLRVYASLACSGNK